MNKKSLILAEAKRLFGRYGYLGFTLKQLAVACEMTSPALYYFYSSKADLFNDCLLSELESRNTLIVDCIQRSETMAEFAATLASNAIEACDLYAFRTGQAMQEIIHLPLAMQTELRDAWNRLLIAPVEAFLRTALPVPPANISYRLLAIYLINMATFSSAHTDEFAVDELCALFVTVVQGLETAPHRI